MNSFYTEQELQEIGFKKIGKNVLISRKTSIYGASNITIGDNTRIDDFTILSGKLTIGDFVHVAVNCALFGGGTGIVLGDFVGVSSRTVIYAETDDYSGEVLTNPMVSDEYKNIICGEVILEKHVLIGSGSTILPGVVIGEGTSLGAMSLANKSLEAWGIYVGIPCKKIKKRSKKLLEKEKLFLEEVSGK